MLGSATAPGGTWHVSSSGEVDRTTVTVPGAVNAQVPAELVAWHTKGPAHAEDSASTRTSIDCSAGGLWAQPARPEAASSQAAGGSRSVGMTWRMTADN
jgi:hypothetical protein